MTLKANACLLPFRLMLYQTHYIYLHHLKIRPVSFSLKHLHALIDIEIRLININNGQQQPPTDSKGKSSLLIEDACWSYNDQFVVMLLLSQCLAVASRVGNLIKFINPTIKNFNSAFPNMTLQEAGISAIDQSKFNKIFFEKSSSSQGILSKLFSKSSTSSSSSSSQNNKKSGDSSLKMCITRSNKKLDSFIIMVDKQYICLNMFAQRSSAISDPFYNLRLMLSKKDNLYDQELLKNLPNLFQGILPQKEDFYFKT